MKTPNLDFQILSIKVSQELQEEEESAQGKVDQGLSQECWKGVGSGSHVWVWKKAQWACQVQQRSLEKNKYVFYEPVEFEKWR